MATLMASTKAATVEILMIDVYFVVIATSRTSRIILLSVESFHSKSVSATLPYPAPLSNVITSGAM